MPGIELNWPNKNRVLYEVPQRGQGKPVYYGDPGTPSWPDHRPLLRVSTHGDPDTDPNRLIQGDNLVGLQALLDEGMGRRFKCICIDPPYNTGSAFTHYDDGFENTIWLGMMRDRVKLLYKLLAEDGSLWIFIDDNQAHYLKVVCDEIFGRRNFVANVIWQKKYAPANDAKWLSDSHDHVLVYAKDKETWRPNKLVRSAGSSAAYKNPDNDPRGLWKAGDYTCNKSADERPNLYYAICQPNTRQEIWPNSSRVWAYGKTQHEENEELGLVWWGKDGNNATPAYKRFLASMEGGTVAQTIWMWDDVGHTQEGRKHQLAMNMEDPFATPKPERVVERVVQLATNEGDWVLDSFAGSGTTAAVASQMNRRWVTIEMGDHAETHCLPRLEKARLGAPPYKFAAGGGFVFERVGPPLVIHDNALGIQKMNPEYVNGTYQRAVCFLTGFKHQPDDPVLHGRATTDGGRFCHIAERGVLVTEEYLHAIRQTLASLAHTNGQDMSTCVVYATKTATDGGEGIEVVRIPAGFTSSRKNGNKNEKTVG